VAYTVFSILSDTLLKVLLKHQQLMPNVPRSLGVTAGCLQQGK